VARIRPFERRLLLVWLGSAVLFLLVLGLFALFIFRSLSSRITESVLAESRADAETIARRLAGGGGGLRVSEQTKETELYLHSVLHEKRTVEYITVTDREGRQLFEGRAEGKRSFFDLPPSPEINLPDGTGRRTTTSERDYDIAVPIENIGFVHVGVSKDAVAARLESVRADLVRKAGVAAAAALLALAVSDVFLWRLLERNRRLEAERSENVHLAELGTVASGLAHEIRNPLHAIGLSLDSLRERFPSDSGRFDLARSEVRRLDRLVTDFLQYARPAPLAVTEMSLRSLLREAAALAAIEARSSDATVDVGAYPDLSVRWDGAKIRQVIWNVVRNAVEAAASPGASSRIVEISAEESAGRRLCLKVQDHGLGIPAETLSKIPSLFFTTKKGGSGLGLMVASRIVREHGGRLRIESQVGRGTLVTIEMPQSVEEDSA
jgi:signal transduction histidine kinase